MTFWTPPPQGPLATNSIQGGALQMGLNVIWRTPPIHAGNLKIRNRFLDPRVPILMPSEKFGSTKMKISEIAARRKL